MHTLEAIMEAHWGVLPRKEPGISTILLRPIDWVGRRHVAPGKAIHKRL
jgi:hypothetical protein